MPISISTSAATFATAPVSARSTPERSTAQVTARYWLQTGRIDVGFLGAAQIDRFANINTTVIGSYEKPKVRLPGAGGAPEIAASAKEVIIVLRHTPRAFVEELAFRTSPKSSFHLVGQLQQFKDSPRVEEQEHWVKRLRLELRFSH